MGRIARREERRRAERERTAAVARALLESEPREAARIIVSLHVAVAGEQLPRIPVIGLEPGAIRGTLPHRKRMCYESRYGKQGACS